ncbi:biosynthetic-type acetolactate synthase large subunit [Desulfocurvibacter africanus]|uniref:Acetolactate synthase n=1 Tax=Desulfocurvibacter africanus subsp. africanus str. Walvis Bay TaxID=690850 RepID=F3Z474_DESAF|nr:biosynthetic-type acetolactate synthase large subunit [Desulfocurvibacter africanus]EGJ51616.1 acetolactate synthase, large subunit, biosynthetic type [Desulfocurvibacter africanus subsp. africanus str. Walvis Bay]
MCAMIRMTGAEIIVRLLERQGVAVVAGIPGGANLPLYDALSRSPIRHVLARHEQGAGFIAQGMARTTGRPAVCLATSGPGATNLLTAIADAKLDSVPLVCITGQVPRGLLGTDAFQEVDTYGLAMPITKHAWLARSASELLTIIPEAFRLASSGRAGPVLVDVPKDVQQEYAEFDQWPEPGLPELVAGPDIQVLERAAALLDSARRPAMILGGGVIASGASELAVRLAERCAMPTAMTLMGLGAMPAGHPQYLGMLGMHGMRCTNTILHECDLLLAVGMRFDDRATGVASRFCPEAEIIHIDIDASEIGKIKSASVGLATDAAQALEALLGMTRQRPRVGWQHRVRQIRQADAALDELNTDLRTPRGILASLAAQLPEDAIIVTDVGQHQMWTAMHYPFRRPRTLLTSGGLGTMGFGLPTAIGAALAKPDARIVLVTGDGSLQMNLQELATAAEEGANITIVLMDNGSLGLVHQQQDLFFGRRHYASTFRHGVDFCQVARGFGMRAANLHEARDPHAAMSRALCGSGPCLIRARVDASDHVLPMVPPGASNTETIVPQPRMKEEAHVRACA